MSSEDNRPVVTAEQMREFRFAVMHNNDDVVPWRVWERACVAFGLDAKDDDQTRRLYDAIIRSADRREAAE